MRSTDAEDELIARLSRFGTSPSSPAYSDVERTWQELRAFADEPVEDLDTDDPLADTWLAQHGTYGGGTFVLNMTREFRFTDENGNHSRSIQLSCDLDFAPFPQLKGVSGAELSSAGLGLDDFFRQALALPGFRRIQQHKASPKGLRLRYDNW